MVEFEGVNPRERRGETAEVEMVFDSESFAALGVDGSDFVLDFFESALDLPSCGIELDHLFCAETQVCGEDGEREIFVVDKDDFDRASEGLGHADEFGEYDFADLAIEMDFRASGRLAQLSGKRLDSGEPFAELRAAPTLAGWRVRKGMEHGTYAEAGQEMDNETGFFSDFLEKGLAAEPTVADEQCLAVEERDNLQHKFGADSGFGFEPRGVRQLCGGLDCLGQWQVEFLREGQASPAPVSITQNSCDNPAVAKNPCRGIFLVGVVEMPGATSDLFAGFPVAGVVEGDEDAPVKGRIAKLGCQKTPEVLPRELGGVEELVETLAVRLACQQGRKGSEDRTDAPWTITGAERDKKGLEYTLAIGGNFRGRLFKEFGKFHPLSLSMLFGQWILYHKQSQRSISQDAYGQYLRPRNLASPKAPWIHKKRFQVKNEVKQHKRSGRRLENQVIAFYYEGGDF